jgi:hypothetical protein
MTPDHPMGTHGYPWTWHCGASVDWQMAEAKAWGEKS